MRKLTPVHIEAFEAELQREGYLKGSKKGGALAAQTVLHIHRTLSQALAHAVKTDVLFKNPADQVRPPRPPGREIRILTKPEIAKVLQAGGADAICPGARRGHDWGEARGAFWPAVVRP